VPATYAYGTGDEEATAYYRALALAMRALNPLVTPHEIPGALHAAHLDHPRLLAAVLEERWLACASG
jgi:pimeloyl-ACP methyl ester carboxylesterase